MLNKFKDTRGNFADDYTCDDCKTLGSCTKVDQILEVSDILIIHLLLFKYDINAGAIKKVIPNLKIDEEISEFRGDWTLHAIIYHEGRRANSGHYTCNIKMNESWFN